MMKSFSSRFTDAAAAFVYHDPAQLKQALILRFLPDPHFFFLVNRFSASAAFFFFFNFFCCLIENDFDLRWLVVYQSSTLVLFFSSTN